MDIRERVTASVADIRDRGQRLVQLNRELLTTELKQTGQKIGAGVGLVAAAALLSLYAIGFALATVAVAIALVLSLWLSLLIVTVILFVVVAILVLVGRGLLRQSKDAAPKAALAEAKKTADVVKTNLRETAAGVRSTLVPRRTVVDADSDAPAAVSPLGASDPYGGPPEMSPDREGMDS